MATRAAAGLPPVTLIAGDEPLLVIEAAAAWRQQARAQGYVEREVHDLQFSSRGGDEAEDGESSGGRGRVDWESVRYGFEALGLFTQRKMVEWRLSATRMDAEGLKLLKEFLAAPPADIRLLILAPEYNKKLGESQWIKAIAAGGSVQPIWKIKPAELPRWLIQRARGLGLNLTPNGAQLLADRVEGHLLAASQDLQQLALLAPGATLGAREVAEQIADAAHFDVFRLTEAALLGQADRAVRMLRSIRAEGEHPAALWSWLYSQLGIAAQLAQSVERGADPGAVVQQAGLWEPRASAMKAALGRGRAADWEARWLECARLDRMLKGHALAEPWLEFERLLLRMALPPKQARAFAVCAPVGP